MARLSTHVLDTVLGRPAAGVAVKLYSMHGDRHLVASAKTNVDGRTDDPLLNDETFIAGRYELEFAIGEYFAQQGTDGVSEPPFLDDVVIRFNLRDGENYHVPLLASPWSYSTYRGS